MSIGRLHDAFKPLSKQLSATSFCAYRTIDPARKLAISCELGHHGGDERNARI
jgi:hypothetical protein